jgi:P27 family predicted phage terminase small subunit
MGKRKKVTTRDIAEYAGISQSTVSMILSEKKNVSFSPETIKAVQEAARVLGYKKPEKKAPPCPKWLEPEAKKEWRRLSKQMEQIGILTEVDMASFAGYCQAYARWKEAEEFITQHGTIVKTPSGYWQQVPQVSIAQTYLKVMNRFAEQFGLTPASRSRIIADTLGGGTEDELEALLGGDA